MKKNQGVSLIEILVSCVIIALLVGGLGSVFVAGSRWVMNIHSHAAAEELGKLFLDPMQMHVRGSDWEDTIGINALGLDPGSSPRITHCDTPPTFPQNPLCPADADRHVGKIDYEVDYNVQNLVLNGVDYHVRKVRAVIHWPEPQTL